MSMTRAQDLEADNPDEVIVRCGPVNADTVYGRLHTNTRPHVEEWVAMPADVATSHVDGTYEGPETLTFHPARYPTDLPAGIQFVSWSEISVDLHVRTPLTKREADVYVMSRWFSLRRREIAEHLDISPNTVDNHLTRIRNIDDEMLTLVINTVESLGLEEELVDALPNVQYAESTS